MELNGKALVFVTEALRYRLTWYDSELAKPGLSDDARSDLTNDKHFVASLIESLGGRRVTEPGHG